MLSVVVWQSALLGYVMNPYDDFDMWPPIGNHPGSPGPK